MKPTAAQTAAMVRPLPLALAHAMAGIKPGNPRAYLLNKLYCAMLPAAQMACRMELLEIRDAQRSNIKTVCRA